LYLQFFLCEKLGYTIQEFRERVTHEELIYWSSYLEIKNEREKAEYDKIRKEAQTKRAR